MLSKVSKLFSEVDREAWIRFVVALLGLVFSFTFAIISSSFREEGSLIATAITASLALFTAALVGVATVPYLARRVAFERKRFAVRYEVTREGLGYTAVVLVIGIAALNTGNNLLFIIVAAMLSAVLVSGIASTIVLFGLTLNVSIPEHVFAKKPFIGTITVTNSGRLPSFSVSVVPEKMKANRSWRWQRTEIGIPPFRPAGKEWFRMPDLQLRSVPPKKPEPPIITRPLYFPYLAPRHSQSAPIELNFPRRGRYVQKGLGLSTRFPFSFVSKTRIVPFERMLLVLPTVEETDEFLSILPTLRGEFEAFVAGRGHDLYRLREFAPGDAARHIDWKASSRAQTVMVREFTREDERKLRVVFDNPAPRALSEDDYERAVSLVASVAWHFSSGGARVNFHAPGYDGPQEALSFLKYLASVHPSETPLRFEEIGGGAYNLVVTARQRGSIPTQLWNTCYFIFVSDRRTS
jgi:uncharacterized protein (DUF58 family)